MPFTEQRARLETLETPSKALLIPGNRTWAIYREMKRLWKLNRRWTTADMIYTAFVFDTENNEVLIDIHNKCPLLGWDEVCSASHLAWQVFFQLEVMPYELEKRSLNGDVE